MKIENIDLLEKEMEIESENSSSSSPSPPDTNIQINGFIDLVYEEVWDY